MTIKTENEINWRDEYMDLKEKQIMLERDRACLWGVNEELRKKILALQDGQMDLFHECEKLRFEKAELMTRVNLLGFNEMLFSRYAAPDAAAIPAEPPFAENAK